MNRLRPTSTLTRCAALAAAVVSSSLSPSFAQDSTRARPATAATATTAAEAAAVNERLRRFREETSDPAGDRASSAPSARPVRPYSKPEGPVEIVVRIRDAHGPLALFLLDACGEVLSLATIESGRVDLRAALPGVATLTKAAWVQLAQADKPLGPPIVVQPILEPPPVRTMRDMRSGTTSPYTKVIGWGSEMLDAADPRIKEESVKWIAGDPPVLSGYRTYTEMDALIRTDHGEIRVALSPDEAPSTVWNFRTLIREGFYDNGGFHRVVPVDRKGHPFVIQGGDPTQTGNGGPGYALALEPSTLAHDYGVISMARADEPHSAGSQFFFALGREGCARLDGQYCAFGYAVLGNRVIDSIAATPIADVAEGRPVTIPRILTIRLIEAPARMPGIDRRQDRVKPTDRAGQTSPETR